MLEPLLAAPAFQLPEAEKSRLLALSLIHI